MTTTDSTTTAIQAVPTNIITGFLGTGKTSAILQLLARKPADERWAVLVNEFGEIGVDGAILNGLYPEEGGVFIREVPGGCMCCTAGLPMQIALNQLLARAKPDRLLIEPTGLGHPLEVLNSLLAEHYQETLAVQKILTLVDARKVSDARYRKHDIFNQQIEIADIVIGNKQDLYGAGDAAMLEAYLKEKHFQPEQLLFTSQGIIDPDLLQGSTKAMAETSHHHHHHGSENNNPINDQAIPAGGYLTAINQGEGFESIGWRFDPSLVFDRDQLFGFLSGLAVERMKAVFITDDGVFGYNLAQDALTEMVLDESVESRIEIIAEHIDPDWEAQLLQCAPQQA